MKFLSIIFILINSCFLNANSSEDLNQRIIEEKRAEAKKLLGEASWELLQSSFYLTETVLAAEVHFFYH